MTRIELPIEKKVKHLTLLRQPRIITGTEFNSLTADERLMMVRSADSGQRYRLLIEAVDGPELMSRLPEQDLFLMLKEIGEDEVADLMPMITPDQYTACIDLDCWDSDNFQNDTALVWLERLLECEPTTVLTTIRDMNFELLILVLKKNIQIIQGMETLHDADNQVNALDRIGGYEVNFTGERESKLFSALFTILFQFDAPFYIYLMEACRGELDSVIEESVYLQRSDRMLDLGLPDPDSARSIYAWLDPETFAPEEEKLSMAKLESEMAPPAFMLAVARPKNLLAAALDEGLSDSGCWELAYLANKVLVTNQVDVGERSEMQDSMEEMFARLNIALEYLCADDLKKAVELLDHAYFEHLFRLGYSLTIKLQRRANKLQTATIGPYLDASDKTFLQALLRKPHALLYEGLEHPGIEDERNFQNLHDLRVAADRLDQLELLRKLFEEKLPFSLPEPDTDLPGCTPASTSDLDLSTLFLTALANRILDREFAPEPIPVADLSLLHERITRNRKLDPRLRAETVAWVESLIDNGEKVVHNALDIWAENFCPIDPTDIDPRYLDGLIIRT
jgi:hypothetical protein